MAIPEVSFSFTGRCNQTGQAFSEKPEERSPNSRGTATMAPHVIVEFSVFARTGPRSP